MMRSTSNVGDARLHQSLSVLLTLRFPQYRCVFNRYSSMYSHRCFDGYTIFSGYFQDNDITCVHGGQDDIIDEQWVYLIMRIP